MSVGIFDSGVGGLTVFQAIGAAFPRLDMYYLGDTARVPYGNKSPQTIIRYSFECARYLIAKHHISCLIVACNTASSYAVEALQQEFSIPVLGVVHPGAEYALRVSTRGNIGILGTQATVRSNSYRTMLERLSTKPLSITQQACPLFVPLVEEGIIDDEITDLAIRKYLETMNVAELDTIILGCTHYPVLKHRIEALYPHITIVDSATVMIEHLRNLNIPLEESGIRSIAVTDESPAFEALKNRLVGNIPVEKAELDVRMTPA